VPALCHPSTLATPRPDQCTRDAAEHQGTCAWRSDQSTFDVLYSSREPKSPTGARCLYVYNVVFYRPIVKPARARRRRR